jgi:hypothetical protein
MGGTKLVKFEMAKRAVAMARRFEDVVRIKDGFAKLQALARIRDDRRLEIDVAELYSDCVIRIGQLSRELEKAKGNQHQVHRPDGRTKQKALSDAGIGKSLAAEAEELAGGKTKQGQQAATEAVKVAFAKAREDKKPITRKTLRKAVRETLAETLGPPPKRKPRKQPAADPVLDHLLKLTRAIDAINELASDTSRFLVTVEMVERTASMGGIADDLAAVESAIVELQGWRDALVLMVNKRRHLQ